MDIQCALSVKCFSNVNGLGVGEAVQDKKIQGEYFYEKKIISSTFMYVYDSGSGCLWFHQ